VISTIPGLRSWGAVLVAVVLAAIGATIDGVGSGRLGWGFNIGFVVGVALAAVLVRRASIFTAIVQPPLVMVVVMFVAMKLVTNDAIKIIAINIVSSFPVMLTGTAVAVLLGVVRIFAQPMKRAKKPSARQGAPA
jgi:hypothetical protein